MMGFDTVRNAAGRLLDRFVDGPSTQTREQARSYLYVRMTNPAGETAEGWLETLEGYAFTAISALNAVEHLLDDTAKAITGAHTPSTAFGCRFCARNSDHPTHGFTGIVCYNGALCGVFRIYKRSINGAPFHM